VPPELIGFHHEDGHRFSALVIVRHWIRGIIAMEFLGRAAKRALPRSDRKANKNRVLQVYTRLLTLGGLINLDRASLLSLRLLDLWQGKLPGYGPLFSSETSPCLLDLIGPEFLQRPFLNLPDPLLRNQAF
jgi:hypothetical protein